MERPRPPVGRRGILAHLVAGLKEIWFVVEPPLGNILIALLEGREQGGIVEGAHVIPKTIRVAVNKQLDEQEPTIILVKVGRDLKMIIKLSIFVSSIDCASIGTALDQIKCSDGARQIALKESFRYPGDCLVDLRIKTIPNASH